MFTWSNFGKCSVMLLKRRLLSLVWQDICMGLNLVSMRSLQLIIVQDDFSSHLLAREGNLVADESASDDVVFIPPVMSRFRAIWFFLVFLLVLLVASTAHAAKAYSSTGRRYPANIWFNILLLTPYLVPVSFIRRDIHRNAIFSVSWRCGFHACHLSSLILKYVRFCYFWIGIMLTLKWSWTLLTGHVNMHRALCEKSTWGDYQKRSFRATAPISDAWTAWISSPLFNTDA